MRAKDTLSAVGRNDSIVRMRATILVRVSGEAQVLLLERDKKAKGTPHKEDEVSEDKIVETIYGNYHKYTVIRKSKLFGGYEYWIRRDDKPYKGSYRTLIAAVEAAQLEP